MSRSRARSRSRGYQRAMPFNPLHLGSSLALWLRADSGVTLGGTPLATGTAPPVVTIATTDGVNPYGFLSLRIEITTGGARGTALFRWSTDDGTTWQATGVATAATVALAGFNCTISFPAGAYTNDNVYRTTVGSWSDLSGNARHAAQATASKQPISSSVAGPNAKPAIVFDGSTSVLQVPSFAWGTATASIYTVEKTRTGAATGRFIFEFGATYATAAGLFGYYGAANQSWRGHGNTDAIARTSVYATNTWYSVTSTHDRSLATGEVVTLRTNGSSDRTVTFDGNNAGNFGTNAINIGARNNGASLWWDGSIAEIVICSTVLSSADNSRVEDYLRAKWAHY